MARSSLFRNDTSHSFQKIIPIRIIDKKLAALDSPNDDMMECAGCIYAGFSRHNIHIA